MMDRLVYYIDNRSPIIERRLSAQNTGTFDVLPGQDFRLRVRGRDGAAVLLDKVMTSDPVADTITYAPEAGDFADEGIYRAWVVVDFGAGVTQDTDEFEILVMAHAPGEGARVGPVYSAARAMAPVAWDALRGYRDYGDFELQRVIDLAKLRVMRSAVPVANEASLDIRVVDYIARKVLVDNVLEAAINWWTNQIVSQTARGNSDQVNTYPDRIAAHERMLERFRTQLAGQQAELEEILGGATGPTKLAPALIGGGSPITPGLESFPRPYRHLRPSEEGSQW